jgi:hypothetical protein
MLSSGLMKLLFQVIIHSILYQYTTVIGVCGSVVVKALCYKPEGRGFDTR